MTLISVVIPAYNSAAYIAESVESMLHQTLGDLEVIVVDDGSTDDTAVVVARCAATDPRVRLIRLEEPSGRPACARNEGLRRARGKYIAFLDADDFSVPNRLELMIAALKDTNARLAFSDYRQFHDETGVYDVEPGLNTHGFLRHAVGYLDAVSPHTFLTRPQFVGFLLVRPVVAPQTVVLERSLLVEEHYWFDESLRCGEDQDLWLRLAVRSQFVFLDRPLTFIRKHAGSLTASQHMRTVSDVTTVRRSNLKRFRNQLSRTEVGETRSRIASGLRDIGYGLWVTADGRGARKAFRDSLMYEPSLAACKGYLKALVPRSAAVALATRMSLR